MNRVVKVATAVVVTAVASGCVYYYLKSKKEYPGNASKYDLNHTETLADSPLKGKKIIFLGSSVTYGSAAKGNSFVDYLKKRDGIIPYKHAVSGTTLVDKTVWGKKSYIERMKKIDTSIEADAFVCQLSTNDATMNLKLGNIISSYQLEDFDTKTIIGAIEFIIAYARKTWNCPVIFYTGTKYQSKKYREMINILYSLKNKWDIEIIDLWNDDEMYQITKEEYDLFMANGIHPTRAGYRDWWTPKFEKELIKIFEDK